MGKYIQRFKQSPVGRFLTKFSADEGTSGAILIAWQALLSLFPIIIGFLALFGLVIRDPEQRDAVVTSIQQQFPSQVDDLLSFLDETRDATGVLGIIGIAGLFWSGSNLFGQIAHTFNRFYTAPDRGFIAQKLLAFAMMAIYLVLAVFSVAANAAGAAAAELANWLFNQPLEGLAATIALVIGWVLSLASAFLLFLVLFRFIPNTPLSFRQVWKGALLSAVLFVLLNQLFPIYLQFFGGGFEAYKTFGLFLLLMTWFYFLGNILCLGAELNAFLLARGVHTEADVAKIQAGQTTGFPARDPAGSGRRGRRRGTDQRQPAGNAAPGRVLLWTGLTAIMTGITLGAARSLAASIYRTLTGDDPPVKAQS
jgi:membrane protein